VIQDKVYVFENYLTKEACEKYLKKIKDIGYREKLASWEERTTDISDDPIAETVRHFLNNRFYLNLELDQVQTQNWHINSYGPLHKHDRDGRQNTVFNSLIYLNDDFEGGEFITQKGFVLKPKQGMLTFFNGSKIIHGTRRTLSKDRKTLIFWWK
jgi:hypothetical protein|tara:strand:+ start:244 stop:708 length:465 start_codon:yes stop_codon:yes gene_type:complete